MYQQFFYLVTGIAMIIVTIVTIILCVVILMKNSRDRQSSRYKERVANELNRIEERIDEFDQTAISWVKDIEKLKRRTAHIGEPGATAKLEMQEGFEEVRREFYERMERLQEQLNESKD